MADREINTTSDMRINQYLTHVGTFFIFLGMTRLIFFYKSFGILIIDYLDFSEIITSFFDIIVILILFFATISIQHYLTSDKTEIGNATEKQQKILAEENIWQIYLLYIKYLMPAFLLLLATMIGCFIWRYFFKEPTYFSICIIALIYIGLLIFIIISMEIERKHRHFNSSINRKRYINIMLYGLVFTFSVIYYSVYQVHSIKIDKSTYGVTIILDNDKSIVSDSTNYYIGKTKNYLFVYHEKQNTTDIIPMTRVRQMTMTREIISK